MIENDIQKAVSILKKGGLVAMPTETVYGLAADAKNPEALKKIFAAKNRPIDHPLIVHIADLSQLSEWAVDVSEEALQLARTFWPGPLTLILKKAPSVTDIITGGQNTIGIRVPNHPIAQALLKAFDSGVAAPSANRFGRISPTTAAAVQEELGNTVDIILDGGQCDVGVESTILDASTHDFRILRPGMISENQIEAVLQQHLSHTKNNLPRVSGSLESHYAPVTKTFLMTRQEIENFLRENTDAHCAVLLISKSAIVGKCKIVQMSETPRQYAHDLYFILRELDKGHFNQILIEQVPATAAWAAISDRLGRAAMR